MGNKINTRKKQKRYAKDKKTPQSATKQIDLLGILSLVLIIIPPVGLIVGLVGASKAKRTGRSVILSRTGWIINLVLIIVIIIAPALIVGYFDRVLERAKRGDVPSSASSQQETPSAELYKGDMKLDFAQGETADFNGISVKVNDITKKYSTSDNKIAFPNGIDDLTIDITITNNRNETVFMPIFQLDVVGAGKSSRIPNHALTDLPESQLLPQFTDEISAGQTVYGKAAFDSIPAGSKNIKLTTSIMISKKDDPGGQPGLARFTLAL